MLASTLFSVAAQPALAAPVVKLDPGLQEVPLDGAQGWFGPQPRGGIVSVSAGGVPLATIPSSRVHRFREGESLWLKLQVQADASPAQPWVLEVPVPVIDSVTLYQQDASGRWFGRAAGDLVPMRNWPAPGRYPAFRVELRSDGPTELYLEVRHASSIALPVRFVTATAHHERTRLEYLGLGLVIGALGLLVLGSVVASLLLRDPVFGWYSVYALIALLALAAFTGVAAHLIWGNSGAWVDRAPGVLVLLGASIVVVIVGRLSAVLSRTRWLGRALQLLGWIGPACALLFFLLDKVAGIAVLGGYIVAVTIASLCAAVIILRRGDRVGAWMLAGAVPLALSVLLALARVSGWSPDGWPTEYVLVGALTIELPLLLGALGSRSQERRGVELRRMAAESQDALTGLMKRDPFVARLRHAIARYQRRGEGAAIAVIEVANHAWIQKSRGPEAAEEALLRSVIKLRRLVRDVDSAGRLGENRFGLILEGVTLRKPMAALAARLVAEGLMEEPGRPRDAPLHFHLAAVVLHERTATADELLDALHETLAAMGPRPHKPVGFLEAAHPSTVADGLHPMGGPTPAAGAAPASAPG